MNKFKIDKRLYEAAVEASRMPMIFVSATSPANTIIYANASFLEMMDYADAEIAGQPFLATIAKLKNSWSLAEWGVKSRPPRPLHYVTCVRGSGEEFSAALLVAPVVDDAGDPKYFFVSYEDLSNEFEGDTAYARQINQRYVHAPGFIALTHGPEHRFTFANRAYEVLVGRRNLVGQTVMDAFPELKDEGIFEILDSVYKTQRPFYGTRMPVRLQREQGQASEVRYVDFVFEPILDIGSRVTGLFCEGYDVTEKNSKEREVRLLQAQLVQLSRLNAMGTLAATLAHELNQPLAAISNYAAGCTNLLAADGVQGGKVEEGLKAIAGASERAGHIIRRLRDMTRRTTPVHEAFELSEALDDAVHLVRAGGWDNFRIESSAMKTGQVKGDRIQVQQVIVNLLKNACEAAAERNDGVVTTSVSENGGHLKLTVNDNGGGMPEETQKNLFAWSKSTKPDGMGIGLSISRTIIEGHGGNIWLEHTGRSGTSISLTLPRA